MKMILFLIIAIIGVMCLVGAVKWINDSTSRIELRSGGKSYELVEQWVWSESFGLAADGYWFPTSAAMLPEFAKELDDFALISYSDDMVLKHKSFFGSRKMTNQLFRLYDEQLNQVEINSFDGLFSLPGGQYYLVVDAAWGFSFRRTGYQYIGKIELP